MSSNCPCFLLQLTFLECFMFHASMVVQFTFHILGIESLVPSELKIESFFKFWFRFQIRVNSLSFFLSLAKLATGFDLAPFWKNVLHSSPRPRCLGVRVEVDWQDDEKNNCDERTRIHDLKRVRGTGFEKG